MKNKKYLRLYKKWMKQGEMDHNGLCEAFMLEDFSMDSFFELMIPKSEPVGFWAFDGKHLWTIELPYGSPTSLIRRKFTPLRQNIVLLMAAMNGEL